MAFNANKESAPADSPRVVALQGAVDGKISPERCNLYYPNIYLQTSHIQRCFAMTEIVFQWKIVVTVAKNQ